MAMKHPVHPGRLIKHCVESSGLSVTEAAKRLGVTRQTLSRVINAKTALSAEMAIRVSKAFGSTPEHWLRMQMACDMAGLRDKAARIKVKRFPFRGGRNVKMEIQFSEQEKEILALHATFLSINEMVNNAIMTINHNDPDSSIMFNTSSDAKYFNIILLDFLNSKIFGLGKNCIDALNDVCDKPLFHDDPSCLRAAVTAFQSWLDSKIELKHDGETRTFWFPSIDTDIALQIKRAEFIKICGNISKHNTLALNKQADIITEIFKRNGVTIDTTKAILIMETFYEQFHDDLLNYHASTIAEFLNNIRWEIYEFIKPLYQKSVQFYCHDDLNVEAYRYSFPEGLNNDYAKEIFWDLMNNVRSEPYVPRFQVTRYLKMRY